MKKILVVEDQKLLMQALVNSLNKADFEVIEAEDGQEGLEMAIQHHPDLILLDIIMPVMDGLTMLKKLRQDKWGETAKVVILSNLTNTESLETAKQENVADYLIKSNWKLDDVVIKSKETLGL